MSKAAAKPSTRYGYSGQSLPVPAQEAGEELVRIEKAHGALKPSTIVEASKPEDAVLHPCFTWDDEEAARLHRESEARRIVRSVRVVKIESSTGRKEVSPSYISVTQPDGQGRSYISTARVLSDTDMRAQALCDALAQLDGIRKRYQNLAELAGVFEAMDEVANAKRTDPNKPR